MSNNLSKSISLSPFCALVSPSIFYLILSHPPSTSSHPPPLLQLSSTSFPLPRRCMSQLFDTATEERRSKVCTREVCEMIVLSETRLRIDTLNEDQVVFVHHETLKNLITFQKVGRKTQLPVQREKDFLFHNLPE